MALGVTNIATSLVAQFSADKAGLTTVGYKLVNANGTIRQARTTVGVVDVGSGIYTVPYTPTTAWNGLVIWDTGGASPIYASEDILVIDKFDTLATQTSVNSIASEVSAINLELDSKASQASVDNVATQIGSITVDTTGLATEGAVTALDTKVTSIASEVSAINSELDSKASQASVDSISTQIGSISVDTTGLATEGAVTALDTKVTSIASEVSAINLELDSKASQASVDNVATAVDSLPTAVPSAPTVTEIANGILNASSSDYLTAGSIGEKIKVASEAGVNPLTTAVGSYPSGTIGHLISSIGGVKIEVVSPVSEDGTEFSLYRNTDYYDSEGRAIQFTDINNKWLDLTGATVTISFGGLRKQMTVVNPSGNNKTVSVEFSKEDLFKLRNTSYTFTIRALLSNNHTINLLIGTVNVK